jgi:hypothetical protein
MEEGESTVALLQRQSIVAGEGKTSDRPIDGLQLQDGKTSVDHIVQLYISTQLCRCVSYSYFLQNPAPLPGVMLITSTI